MWRASIALMVACASHGAASVPSCPSTPPAAAAEPGQEKITPARIADAEIVTKSHAILVALDRGELATAKATLGAGYVHFADGSFADRDRELAAVAHWKQDGSHIGGRTWGDEHVFSRGTEVIFVGKATEHQAGNDTHGGYDFEGWYTLAWSREGDAWKLVYLGWQPAGALSQAAEWNQIFHNATGFNHEPNKLLAELARKRAPGTAIDVAMGQGRNAIYLAEAGWKVTGVDISDEGVRQARAAAEARKLQLDAIVADVAAFDYGTARWDLVAMIYAWPALARIPDLQRATRRGGVFVYEYFAPGGPAADAPAVGALAKQFSGWEILRDEIVDDVPDWAADRAKIQRFVARKK